jgi:hypothetical protein
MQIDFSDVQLTIVIEVIVPRLTASLKLTSFAGLDVVIGCMLRLTSSLEYCANIVVYTVCTFYDPN